VIVHDIGDTRFSFRVAGVAYGPSGVLLQRVAGSDHWLLPGGRVEMLEPSRERLAREIQEELGARPRVGRLLRIIESFFALDGKRYPVRARRVRPVLPNRAAREHPDHGRARRLRPPLPTHHAVASP